MPTPAGKLCFSFSFGGLSGIGTVRVVAAADIGEDKLVVDVTFSSATQQAKSQWLPQPRLSACFPPCSQQLKASLHGRRWFL